MNWRVLAKKDFLDAYRKWTLGTMTVFLLLFFVASTYFRVNNPGRGGIAELTFFEGLTISLFVVPLIALLMSHDSITEERELGSLKLLLGLPYTRRDVTVGSAVGRLAVLVTATVIAVFAAAILFVAYGGSIPVGDFVVYLVLLVLLAATYVGIGVGISASVRTTTRSTVGAIVAFVVTLVFWEAIPLALRYLANGFSFPNGPNPPWAVFVARLGPIRAYDTLVGAWMQSNGSWTPSGDAFYFSAWFGLVVLLAWATVPVVLGYLRFRAADL